MNSRSLSLTRCVLVLLLAASTASCSEAEPPQGESALSTPPRAATRSVATADSDAVPVLTDTRASAPVTRADANDGRSTAKGSVGPATGVLAPRPRRVEIGGVDMSGIGHDRGAATAPVVVVELSDYGCPYCGEFARETYPTIERDYVKTGKVFFKYIPFIAGFTRGRESTRAAECAAEQGRFWEMNDALFATQAEWRKGNAIEEQFAALAGALSLDSARFSTCYTDRHTEARTARATAVANGIGVRVTPSFLVNERPVQGALGLAEFRKVLDAALMVEGTRKP